MQIEDALNVFGGIKLRPLQKKIIDAATNNRDILVFLPTGSGKSLTFQVPAILAPSGCTLVISPLLALMENQIQGLTSKGIESATINHKIGEKDRKKLQGKLLNGSGPRLLYISPELACSPGFRDFLGQLVKNKNLNRVVVDEAHCALDWGREFRKEYAQLGFFKAEYPEIPLMALTATANEQAQRKIAETLGLKLENAEVFKCSVNRPNTHYEVYYVEDPTDRLSKIIQFLKGYKRRIESVFGREKAPYPGCGLIYCRSRATTERVAEQLRQAGIGAHAYHAKLEHEQKERVMNNWVRGDPDYMIVVATIAFGMGVDKPDTRFVIHFEMPRNIEEFSQQAGRAGRDNKACLSILYYSLRDRNLNVKFAQTEREIESLRALALYGETTNKCRHLMLANHFETVPKHPSPEWCDYACDICKHQQKVRRLYEKWQDEFYD